MSEKSIGRRIYLTTWKRWRIALQGLFVFLAAVALTLGTLVPARADSTLTITTTTLAAGQVGQTDSGGVGVPSTTADSTASSAAAGATSPLGESGQQIVTASISSRKPIAIVNTLLQPAVAGKHYQQKLVARGGVGADRWTIKGGVLPKGLRLDSQTGSITGVPLGAWKGKIQVVVSDSEHPADTVSKVLGFEVMGVPITIATKTLPLGLSKKPYLSLLVAKGGLGGHTWSVTKGTLPKGILLNKKTGSLSGTPAISGRSTVRFNVADTALPADIATGVFTLTIKASPSSTPVTSTTTPAASTHKPKTLVVGISLPASGYRGPGVAILSLTVTCSSAVTGKVSVQLSLGGLKGSVTAGTACASTGADSVVIHIPGTWGSGSSSVVAIFQAGGQTARKSGTVAIR